MIDLKNPNKREVFDALLKEVQEKQCAELAFPISQEKLHASAETFLNFLTLPQEFKNSLYKPHPVNPRDSGIGYVRKEKKENFSDGKEYFHYLPIVEEYFQGALQSGEPRLTNFIEVARSIHHDAVLIMKSMLHALEVEFPDIYSSFFPDEYENPRTPLRFLKYNTQGKGEFLARGHYDTGGCTLALAESSPGLRVGANEKTLKPVERTGDGIVFMPSLNFSHLTDKRFTPAWHDVVQRSEETLSADTARWAIVMFLAPKDVATPSFEEVHRPL